MEQGCCAPDQTAQLRHRDASGLPIRMMRISSSGVLTRRSCSRVSQICCRGTSAERATRVPAVGRGEPGLTAFSIHLVGSARAFGLCGGIRDAAFDPKIGQRSSGNVELSCAPRGDVEGPLGAQRRESALAIPGEPSEGRGCCECEGGSGGERQNRNEEAALTQHSVGGQKDTSG